MDVDLNGTQGPLGVIVLQPLRVMEVGLRLDGPSTPGASLS